MRAILFLLSVMCMGFFAQAQDNELSKAETFTMPISQNIYIIKVGLIKSPPLAGVFVLKNSRVRRALNFKLKEKDAKLV